MNVIDFFIDLSLNSFPTLNTLNNFNVTLKLLQDSLSKIYKLVLLTFANQH